MLSDFSRENGKALELEMEWFGKVLETRIEQYFHKKEPPVDPLSIPAPDHRAKASSYVDIVNRYRLGAAERLVLMLALAPDVNPLLLDVFFTKNKTFDRPFTEFGGVPGKRHGGFIPTVETAFFLLTGGDLSLRLHFSSLFEHRHVFRRRHIFDLEFEDKSEPFSSTPLRLNQDILDMLTLGRPRDPETGADFPAKRLRTRMEWEDLVLCPQTLEQLKELRAWLDHGDALIDDWKMEKIIKPGYRCLFFGPPGTGKTLTATLLGKLNSRNVYCIDLSRLVSKYIGETEKNLERVFTRAEKRNWILFFDEADALFGKRTRISDAHDRYANQETAYLLQRLEDCPNMVILASNMKSNIDEAFSRRFQSTVYFPIPRKKERFMLWSQGFSPISTLDESIDLDRISSDYELAGGSIVNVIRYCSLMAIRKNTTVISHGDLMAGVRREYEKGGRTA